MSGPDDTATTVIIVSFNTVRLLERCLASVLHEIRAGVDRVVVVDNGSRDGSVDLVQRRFPDVEIIQLPENLGFGAANNRALRELTTPYALLLNSDTEVSPGTLAALIACMQRHPRAAAVGCTLRNIDGSLQRSCWRFPSPMRKIGEALGITRLLRRRSDYGEWDYGSERRVDFAIAACLLLRGDALRRVGLFDRRFFMYSEETDLCRRLARAGWETWYTPGASVLHHGGASGAGAASETALRAEQRYFGKWFGRPGIVALRLSMAGGALLRVPPLAASLLLRPRGARKKQLAIQMHLLRWTLGRGPRATKERTA